MRRGGRSVGIGFLRHAAADQRGFRRLADDDLGLRPLLGQYAPDPLEGAAGPVAGDPVVEPLVFEIVEDLDGCRARVEIGVGLVLELAGHEPAVSCSASSSNFLIMPTARSAAGVRTTLAPRKRISLRRSTLNDSAMIRTSG